MKQINDKLPLRNSELKIPEEDPFEYDLLNRKKNVEILTRLIESTSGPRVISVNAEWGNGKTIFLKMWAQHLHNQKHAVVEFNAWETDFCKNPFITLFSEVEIALNQIVDSIENDSQNSVEQDEILKDIKLFLSNLKIHSFGFAGITVGIKSNNESIIEKNIIEYKDAIKSLKMFKSLLEQTTSKLYELEYKSLVIVIDELDRCRPSYALELLENAKHIFGVKDIVFILGINRSQLEHSIEALYGSKFDAQEYTRRYFDVDYKLPSPSRSDFIENLILKINIENYFNSNIDIDQIGGFDTIKQMLYIFFVDSRISLRTIEQTIQRLGVVYALLEKDRHTYITVAVVILIIKTINSKICEEFVLGNISDLELIKKLPNIERIGYAQDHPIRCFEAIIIVVAMHIDPPMRKKRKHTPLYEHYDNLFIKESKRNGYNTIVESHSGGIISIFQNIYNHYDLRGITNTIEQIEFVSDELLPSEK